MGPVFDLLILALILWWVFRAFGGGRRGREEGLPEEVESRAPSTVERATAERSPGGRPAGAATAQEPEWRRRLKEAVRDWEEEQRRQAGDPPARQRPAALGEPGGVATEPDRRPDYGRREEVAYRPSPEPGRRPSPGPATRPSPAPARGPRPLEADAPGQEGAIATGRPAIAAETGLPSPRRGPRPREIGEEGDIWTRPLEPERRRSGGGRLPRLPGRNALQRAIAHMEILGPPRGIGADDDSPYRPWI